MSVLFVKISLLSELNNVSKFKDSTTNALWREIKVNTFDARHVTIHNLGNVIKVI